MLNAALTFFVLSFISFLFMANKWASMSIESGQALVGGFLVLGLIALGVFYFSDRNIKVPAKTY